MVATLAFLFSATLAPANLYVFSDVSLKYSPVLMTSFSNLLKVVWTGNPLLDLLKVVWTGKSLLHFLKVAWTGMMPGSHSDLACYLGFHLIFLSMMALAPLALLQNQYLLVALTGQHVIVIVVVALLLFFIFWSKASFFHWSNSIVALPSRNLPFECLSLQSLLLQFTP